METNTQYKAQRIGRPISLISRVVCIIGILIRIVVSGRKPLLSLSVLTVKSPVYKACPIVIISKVLLKLLLLVPLIDKNADCGKEKEDDDKKEREHPWLTVIYMDAHNPRGVVVQGKADSFVLKIIH